MVNLNESLESSAPNAERTLLHELFDAMPQLGWTARPDGFIDYYNQRWYEYTGTTYEEMRGWGWQAVHDPEELPRVMEAWARSIATLQPFEQEFPLRRRDGVYRWFLTRVSPSFDNAGALVRWVGINTDIDDLRRERDARDLLVKMSEAMNSTLDYEETVARVAKIAVPHISDMCTVYVRGENGQIDQVAAVHVDATKTNAIKVLHAHAPLDPQLPYGYPKVIRTGETELVTEIRDEFFVLAARDPEHLALMRAVGARSLIVVPLKAQGKHETFGAMAFALTRGTRHFDRRDVALAEQIGARAALVIDNARLFRDTKVAYMERQALLVAAESANRAKDEFLAMLGHELRNPLSPILTALQLLRLRGVQEGERERAVIERQVAHLVRLIDDLLDVSRITRGKIDLKTERIEVAEIVARAVEAASSLLEQKRQHLRLDVARSGLAVRADPVRLAQVISNLLINSAKYTNESGRIAVEAARSADSIVIRVIDNGLGMAPELVPKVFDMFVQERRAIDRSQGGLGLGLAIVRSIVQLHGGTAAAESAGLGHGSTFTIRLPAAPAEELGLTVNDPSSPRLAPQPVRNGTRVLVVDDNEDAAEMMAMSLQASGYQVQTAEDGPAALRLADSFMPAIALLDIGLPSMDGYELAHRLRELRGLRRICLIAVTGYGQESDRERTLAAGFDAHLVKPVDLELIEKTIADFNLTSTRLGVEKP